MVTWELFSDELMKTQFSYNSNTVIISTGYDIRVQSSYCTQMQIMFQILKFYFKIVLHYMCLKRKSCGRLYFITLKQRKVKAIFVLETVILCHSNKNKTNKILFVVTFSSQKKNNNSITSEILKPKIEIKMRIF